MFCKFILAPAGPPTNKTLGTALQYCRMHTLEQQRRQVRRPPSPETPYNLQRTLNSPRFSQQGFLILEENLISV